MEKIPQHRQTISLEEFIGKYLNRRTGTDIKPVGKIVSVNKNILTLHPVEHELVSKMEFHIGGFMANCSNNDEQEYKYTVDESQTLEIRFTKSMLKAGYSVDDNPVYYYDYNF